MVGTRILYNLAAVVRLDSNTKQNMTSPHHCAMQGMTQYSFFMYHYINIKLIVWIYFTKLNYCIARQIDCE